MPDSAAMIHISRESQKREILAIHVVLQIKRARETGAGDFILVPRAVGLLRAKEVTQTTLNTRPVQIAAGAYAHNRPSGLRRGAWADPFGRWIFVRATGFTPPAVAVLAALKPIASTQNPVLSHIFANCPQATQHLPRAIDVIHSPASIPRTVVVLSSDQIFDRVANAFRIAIETDIA